MITRHLKKFNSTAEMKAAIDAGLVTRPFVLFDSSSNTINMQINSDDSPAEVNFSTDRPDNPIVIATPTASNYTYHGYTFAEVYFNAASEYISGFNEPEFLVMTKSYYDLYVAGRVGVTGGFDTLEQAISVLFDEYHLPAADRTYYPATSTNSVWLATYAVTRDSSFEYESPVHYSVSQTGLQLDQTGEYARMENGMTSVEGCILASYKNAEDKRFSYYPLGFILPPYISDSSTYVLNGLYFNDGIALGPTGGNPIPADVSAGAQEYVNWQLLIPKNSLYDKIKYQYYDMSQSLVWNTGTIYDASLSASGTQYNARDLHTCTNSTNADVSLGLAIMLYDGENAASNIVFTPNDVIFRVSPAAEPVPAGSTKSYQIYDNLTHNHDGFYDTSVYGVINTKVKFIGNILDDGAHTHGVGTESDSFRIFGAGEAYYYDRDYPTGLRIESGESGVQNTGTNNLMEYGNFYIKRDGETIASGDTITSENEHGKVTYYPLCVFGAYANPEGGDVTAYLADGSVNVKYFKIYEGNTLVRDLVPARDSSNNVGLLDKVNYKFYENLGNGTGVLGNSLGTIEVTYDASGNVTDTSSNVTPVTYSVAHASGFSYEWDETYEWMLVPTLKMYNDDTSLNYFEAVIYYSYEVEDGLPQGYNTWDEFYAAHNPVFITTQSIFGGNESATYDSSTICCYNPEDTLGDYGGNVIFMGRYINGTVSQGAVTNLVSSTPWVILGEWAPDTPETNPAVEYDNYADDENGEITFDAWMNGDVFGEYGDNCYFKVSTISESEDAQIYEDNTSEGETDWDAYQADYDTMIQTNASGTSYTGDPETPSSITVTYDPSDPVAIYLVLYDENDDYIAHYGVDSGEEGEGEGE